jgi:ribosome-binding protein aMBF1 (putative translation factor)
MQSMGRTKSDGRARRALGMHTRIEERRLDLGLTREQLSAQLGIHASVLHKIERGDVGMTAERVQHLARLLGVSVAWLYGEEKAAS